LPIHTNSLHAKHGTELPSKAGLLTDRSSWNQQPSRPFQNSGLLRWSTRCSQWRNRAGFSPASLFTREFKRAPWTRSE